MIGRVIWWPRPSNHRRAASLFLPIKTGTLKPSLLIEFAISRTCSGSFLRSLRTCNFSASTRQRSIRSEGAGCRFGEACLHFPLLHASPAGGNVPSLSKFSADVSACPHSSSFDPGTAFSGSSGFVSRARRSSRNISCRCVLSESALRNLLYFFMPDS